MKDRRLEWRTVTIPSPVYLSYLEGQYFIVGPYDTFCVPVKDELGMKLEEAFTRQHEEEERKYRKSFSFKWIRFWYRMKRRLKGESL